MKSVFISICLLIPLVILFVIIDRKDFYSNNNVMVQGKSITKQENTPIIKTKPMSSIATTIEPIENPTEIKQPVKTKQPVTETKSAAEKPAEVKPVVETKSVEMKSADNKPPAETKSMEAKPVAQTKPLETKSAAETSPEGKPVPVAVPVATQEEAKKLNAEALIEFEIFKKIRAKTQDRLKRGYKIAFSEQFKDYKTVTLSKSNEEMLSKTGYDLKDFSKREIPSFWSIDFSTIPSDARFKSDDDGFNIASNQGAIRFVGPRYNGMRSSFLFELNVKNKGDQDSEIVFGVHDSGRIKNGYEILSTEKIKSNEEKTIEVELSVFEQHTIIAPTVSVKGAIALTDLKIYRKDHDNFTIVEGEIVERSVLPAPEETDYPDCRYTAHFVGNSIVSGMPCNKELALSIDGFINKKLLSSSYIVKGEKVRCAIVPIEQVPDDLASIQEADDLSLFSLDNYLMTTFFKISTFTDNFNNDNAAVLFKTDTFDFKSVFNRGFNPPLSESIKEAQIKRVEKDLADANKMIAYLEENRDSIEQRFQKAWAKEKDRYSDGFNITKDEQGRDSLCWRNINNSFWGLSPDYTLIPKTPIELPKDKIDALIALRDFLESNGIQLIVSLVPNRFEISSRVINSEFADIPVYQLATYVKQLSEAGIECPYYAKKIIENYDLYPFCYLWPSDDHPGATVQHCLAEEIANRLADYQFEKSLDKSLFSHVLTSTYDDATIPIHKYPSNCDIGYNIAGECYLSDEIRYNGERVTRDPSSDILVIGNSFAVSPGYLNTQHSFSAFLTERMLHPVDDCIVFAQGPMTVIIQRFLDNPEFYLLNKKIVILHIGLEHLNDSGSVWNNIAEMNRKKMLLAGKKLVAIHNINGNGDGIKYFYAEGARSMWQAFENKNDVICFDDKPFVIFEQTVSEIDPSKPVVCIVPTVRSVIFPNIPTLSVNEVSEFVPASYMVRSLFWQDLYFSLPEGTTDLKISLKGQKNTVVGFNKVMIYQ